jgi:hypothetical protein
LAKLQPLETEEGEMTYKYIKTERGNWWKTEYPYDLAECGWCATQHDGSNCNDQEHAEMRQEAKKLRLSGMLEAEPFRARKFRRVVLAFREKFAKFFAPAGLGTLTIGGATPRAGRNGKSHTNPAPGTSSGD